MSMSNTGLARTDTSVIGRWWWTIDRWTLSALATLVALGALFTLAASPSVAERIGVDSFYFVHRQFAIIPIAVLVLVGSSLLSPRNVRIVAGIVLAVSLVLVLFTLASGVEVKGARRWISFAGLSLQPSEFIKPAFAIIAAHLFAQQRLKGASPDYLIVCTLFALITGLLLLQPDFGMAMMISAVWFIQFFLAGLPILWVAILVFGGMGGIVIGYQFLPHVASRIDRFLDPASGDRYQISTSLEAFMSGGLAGRGPGEGTVKEVLPDAHADFIFAVIGEEFGLLACLVIVGIYVFILLRGLSRLIGEENLFIVLAATGLLSQFTLQAIINMASSLDLMPTKGMTLPFLSYGGSSLIALSFGMGLFLALTRRRAGSGET